MIGSKNWITVSRENLRKAPWNYKTDDPQKAEKLAANIERNGQVENVIVRELGDGLYEVVNGNHRLDTFAGLKIEEVVCFNMGDVSDQAAQRLAIETNETKFDRDGVKLAELIANIATEFSLDDLDTTMPFAEGELEAMAKMADFDWSEFNKGDELPPDGGGSGGGGDGDPMTCPECGHIFSSE